MQKTHNHRRPQTARVQCTTRDNRRSAHPLWQQIPPPRIPMINIADHSIQRASPFRRSAPSPAHWSSTPQSAATPINKRPRLAAPPPSPARYGPHPPSRNRAPPTAAHHQTLPWCAAGMAQPAQCGWAAYTWQSAAGEADGAEGV